MPTPQPEGPLDEESSPQSTDAVDSQSQLPRLIAHAINNPLAALLMFLESAREALDHLPPNEEGARRAEEALRMLVEVRKAAERVHAVVDGMRRAPSTAEAVRILAAPPLSSSGDAAAPEAKVARVMVIDDDPLVSSAVKRSLRDHRVSVHANARDALTALRNGERFDLILCDLMMPEVTGMDFYEELVAMDAAQAARVVFVTGGAVTTRARQFVASTRNEVVEKPFDVRKLREIVARALK
jgi:CheY-like chemotaxis protein